MTRDAVTALLTSQLAAFGDLITDLSDDDWRRPTPLPGWDVHAIVAHIIGTESMLLGHPTPDVELPDASHVKNDMGRFNEKWVRALADEAPAAMLARYNDVIGERTRTLATLTDEQYETSTMTPVGPGTVGRFLEIRTVDCYLHEVDIRDAIGQPGAEDSPAAALALDEFAQGLPMVVAKRAGAPEGAVVWVSVSGPIERQYVVVVEGRARLIDGFEGEPTATLRLDSRLLTRLLAGRTNPARHVDEIVTDGDHDLARAVISRLAVAM